MEPSDDNVQMLLAMGFPSESEVKRALKMAKNDMNEAVDILTNGQALSPFEELPSPGATNQLESGGNMDTTESADFPAANLYELEGRVFTDSWSIPYREDESLAKCMFASITLLTEGRAGADDLCSKFLDQCLPESFRKLLNSQAIYRWSGDIQEGVYDMVLILMELVAVSLQMPSKGEQTYIPHVLLEILAQAMNSQCEFHQKNRNMKTKLEFWQDKMGEERVISEPISREYYWLCNLINKFHYHGGLEMITDTICLPKTNLAGMASLTEPLAACVEFLHPALAKPLFEKSMKRILSMIENLGPDDFKDKYIGRACDLLRNVKIICQSLWKKQVDMADEHRLNLVLRMLKCPHFNAKMNSLIEITKMIEDAVTDRDKSAVKGAIPLEKLTSWMAENELLSIILSGSIDQAQYCEKVKKIVEHVGPHLSKEDLEKLWNRTNDQTNHVVDNIHGIFAAAASQFSLEQFADFTQLITENWLKEKEGMKEKLITLLGLIGKDTKNCELAQKVIEVLWELSHREGVNRELVDKALDEMYQIMVDSTVMKDSYKRKYLERCIDSIKKGVWIMPALKQLLSLVKHIVKSATNRADKAKILTEIHKTADITKLLMSSLISCHQTAVTSSLEMGVALCAPLSIDGKYTHQQTIELHLQCLQFVLQEATGVFMSWSRVKEFWDCMVAKPEACDWDRNTCYTWLTERFQELEGEAACNLFTKKLMTDHSFGLSMEGFECWKKFFEYINVHEHKLKGGSVEKMDLIGLEELWGLCLNIRDVEIAQQAISFLLQNIYINLSSKYKRDMATLHKRFITDCHRRLEALLISLRGGGSVVFRSLSQALYTLTAPIVPDLEKLPAPLRPKYAMNIERLLLIVEQYVVTVEEVYHQSRSLLPHGSSFYGSPLTVSCECETRKEHFIIQTHRNESLLSFRSLVADRMNVSPEHILFNQSELKSNKDQRLLGQLGIDDGYKVIFRLSHLSSSNINTSSSTQQSASASALPTVNETSGAAAAAVPSLAIASASASSVLGATSPAKSGNYELEKNLPGVMIAQESQVFKLLYQLADLGEHRITKRVVALLHLIPTDPAVLDMVDNINSSNNGADTESLPGSTLSTPSVSPSPSPRKVRHSTGSTYGSQTSMLSRKSSSASKLVGLFNKGNGSKEITSPFIVRYNLEVLSSRIMPVDFPTDRPTQFCEDFMTGNGLSLILQIFQVDYFPVEVENEVRQACYSLALQLISYLLCGETVRGKSQSASTSTLSAIQTMDVSEFTDMLSCMMRVAWAASIGKHHLSSSMQPTRDLNAYGRLRQNSADSATSSSSETDVTCLHAGVCLSQTSVDAIDSSIAVKAFEIMVFCLCARPELIGHFYSLPCVADFLLDVLTGCCRDEVRICAANSLRKLSDTIPPQSSIEHPKYYLLRVILAARLPYWVSSSSTRGARQRLLAQCLQYFDLRCQMLMNLSHAEQQLLNVDIASMLEDELAWLCNFQPSCKRVSDISTDDILLTGHLRLVRCLLTCEGVDKQKHMSVIHTLLDDFLFPAAKLEKSADSHDSLADFSPKCMVPLSQEAAYEVLLEICHNNCNGLKSVADKLITWHHSSVDTTEWEYMPPVEGRASSGFVGLKNGGATCYMNSVIQQLFMIPGVPESLLGVDEDNGEIQDTKTVFHELQNVFGQLLDSQLQYYQPDQLWHVFKLWGNSVNVREQQDAFDFFTALTDQLDETLKRYKREPVFQNRLQGVFSDQKNCEDCPHKYEREEPFFALNLTVSNPSLEESLDQFVKGELLEGDNAYFCEKCNLKRNAVKRMCIKTLPPVLCIHLKRFNFDWEANKALKFDDYFKFPLVLDMGPYTADGKSVRYELVGMVVHTGQASAGHYYSFIKDRRGNSMSNETYGKWFKFNDTTVEEFDMTEEAMATECFGGKYKAKTTETCFGPTKLPEDRVRYWNAYLLFYERIRTSRMSGRRTSSRLKVLRRSHDSPGSGSVRQDSLSELSELVHQGEKQGVFTSKIPGRVQKSIRLDNLQFLRNRNVYSEEYFRFIRNLVSIEAGGDVVMLKIQVEMALKFMLNTYLRTKETLRPDMRPWYKWFKSAFEKCPEALAWFIDYITEDPHTYITPYLLTCGIKEIREFYVDVVRSATEDYVMHLHENGQNVTMLDTLLETLLALLSREVVEHAKNSQEYFEFFYRYSKLSELTCDHLLSQDVFQLFVNFVVGKVPEDSTLETLPRRFTVIQTREFWPLQCCLAILLLHLDLRAQSDAEMLSGRSERKFPFVKKHPNPLFSITDDTANVLKASYCPFYIREALITLKEMDHGSSSILLVVDGLVYAAHGLSHFNDSLIQQIRQQCVSTPGNELRGITNLATQLLLLPDSAQQNRCEDLISEPANGILKIIRDSQSSDSQKSYQLIKLLITASNRSEDVSRYLMRCASKWQWCVDWLKKKMEEPSWVSHTPATNEGTLSRNFQRTTSAQITLETATALFTNSQGSSSDMDVDSIHSEELQAVPNIETVTTNLDNAPE